MTVARLRLSILKPLLITIALLVVCVVLSYADMTNTLIVRMNIENPG